MKKFLALALALAMVLDAYYTQQAPSNMDGACCSDSRSSENCLRNIQYLVAAVIDVGAVPGEHAAWKF